MKVNFEEIFNDSYERVLGATKDKVIFFNRFYDIFISSSPIVKEKFKDSDMDTQKKMVPKAFYHVLQFYLKKNSRSYMDEIAKKHSKAGIDIKPQLYDLFLSCLIDTLKELDNEFNDDVELAWRMVFSSGITYMKFKYDKY